MQLHENTRASRTPYLLIVLAVVLQLALAPQVSIAGGTFNFMVVIAVVFALSSDATTAVCIGFAAGLFHDFTASVPAGLMALVLTIASFALVHVSKGALRGLTLDSVRLACVTVLAVNVVYGALLFFMGVESSLLWSVFGHGVSSSVLDIAAVVPFLFLSVPQGSPRAFSMRGRGRNAHKSRFKNLK